MAKFKAIGAIAINQDIHATTTIAGVQKLGTRVKAIDVASASDYGEGEFIYLKGVASTVVGSVVTYDSGGWTTALVDQDHFGNVAVSMSINVADQYGWYQIHGRGVVTAVAGAADASQMYLQENQVGKVVHTPLAGDAVHGMESTSGVGTPDTGLAEVTMSYPCLTNE